MSMSPHDPRRSLLPARRPGAAGRARRHRRAASLGIGLRRSRSAGRHDRGVRRGSPQRPMERRRGHGARARAVPHRRHGVACDRRAVGDGRRRRAGRGRSPARSQDARPARRRARVRQGDLRHERAADHRVERRVGAALPGTGAARCARDRAAARRRRDRARQDGGRRLRLPRRGHEQPHRAGAQSLRSPPARARLAAPAPDRRSRSRAAWRSPRSGQTTAGPTAFRPSAPASSA